MNPTKLILWAVMAASILFIIPQVFVLLILGLSPTIVAFIVDKSKEKYAFLSVGAMNLAGVIPSLIELWNGENSVAAAMDILTNPFDLLIMFAGAAFGWILYLAIPPVVNSLLTIIAHHRISGIRTEQKKLVKEWGEGIAIGPQAIEAQENADNGNTPSSAEAPLEEQNVEAVNSEQPNDTGDTPEFQNPSNT